MNLPCRGCNLDGALMLRNVADVVLARQAGMAAALLGHPLDKAAKLDHLGHSMADHAHGLGRLEALRHGGGDASRWGRVREAARQARAVAA